MNAKEVAKMLGVHPNTIYNMIREGKIEAEKVGKSFEIPQEQVVELRMLQKTSEYNAASEQAAYTLILDYEAELASSGDMLLGVMKHILEDISEADSQNIFYGGLLLEQGRFNQLIDLVKDIEKKRSMIEEMKRVARENGAKNTVEKQQGSAYFIARKRDEQ